MAQPMMHLLIADALYQNKSLSIDSYGEYLLGSIAPDAVHVREDYSRELKDLSHYNFNSHSQLTHFDNFLKKYKTLENKDFTLGYLVHLISDMVWYHIVRVPFKLNYANGLSHHMSMNEAYYYDCEQIDYVLCSDNACSNIIQNLKHSISYSLEGMIEANHVELWKQQFLIKYENKVTHENKTRYLSEYQIRDYILKCQDLCLNYLREVQRES